ncbi:uncharacterized protein JN550_007818 [Neoarthrinium moseri]|uniref:uncharacterized protein n=1 Tax=Neoarthrinium moseri TaxID=1658444 RepID=UPI001FDC1BCE|nr:uncharacterized protein JN550_007818 [Neoarthrinium moseri]KAI1866129.1 hypothetical protein JN550_007818 [Neoarthrinium moseri]
MNLTSFFLGLVATALSAMALPAKVATARELSSADRVALKNALDSLKAENPSAAASVENVQANDYLFNGVWAKRDGDTAIDKSRLSALLDQLKSENPDAVASVEEVQANDYLFNGVWDKRGADKTPVSEHVHLDQRTD